MVGYKHYKNGEIRLFWGEIREPGELLP